LFIRLRKTHTGVKYYFIVSNTDSQNKVNAETVDYVLRVLVSRGSEKPNGVTIEEILNGTLSEHQKSFLKILMCHTSTITHKDFLFKLFISGRFMKKVLHHQ